MNANPTSPESKNDDLNRRFSMGEHTRNSSKSVLPLQETSHTSPPLAHHSQAISTIMEDHSLQMEVRDLILSHRFPIPSTSNLTVTDLGSSLDQLWTLGSPQLAEVEAILSSFSRPTLHVEGDTLHMPDSKVQRSRLEKHSKAIRLASNRCGCLRRLSPSGVYEAIGSAWFVSPKILVTTRSIVLEHIAEQSSGILQNVWFDRMNTTSADKQQNWQVRKVLKIAGTEEGNFAFLEVNTACEEDFEILKQSEFLYERSNVCCVGARLSLLDSFERAVSGFEKTLAPGRLTKCAEKTLIHDCAASALDKGGLLLDLDTGTIAGMHTHSKDGIGQFAVRSKAIYQGLREIPLF